MSPDNVYSGATTPAMNWGDFNPVAFAIQQAIGKMQTATLVQIISCTNEGELSPVGMVDVLPLVNQLDAAGNPTPHITVHNLPYLRLQGGKNAIIIDPQPGDIGLAVFCSRDISKVKSTKDQANPGSARQYSFSDGIYLGGMLNGTPNQFVQFRPSGITITTQVGSKGVDVNAQVGNITNTAGKTTVVTLEKDGPITLTDGQSVVSLNADGTVSLNAPVGLSINTPLFTVNGLMVLNGMMEQYGDADGVGTVTMLGPVNVINDVTAEGTSLHTHVHTGVEPGSSDTGEPQT